MEAHAIARRLPEIKIRKIRVGKSSFITLFSGFLFSIVPMHAFGCSLGDGCLKPFNYDLVKQTGAIVLVEAVGHNPQPGVKFFPNPVFNLNDGENRRISKVTRIIRQNLPLAKTECDFMVYSKVALRDCREFV